MNTLSSGTLLLILTSIILASLSIEMARAQPQTLRVMSFNIRYDNPADAPNNWDNRKERVANLIKFYEPTFLGTQEALLHQLNDLEKKLTNYKWFGKGRKDGKNGGEFSAIFYDSRKVKLIGKTDSTIWLSKTPGKPSKSWDAALPRILTWGKFRIKSTSEEIFVFNTHFDHRGETARLNSAEIILQTIKEVAGNAPVVLMGDFNVLDSSKPYRILTSSFLQDAFRTSALPNVGPNFTYSGFRVADTSDQRRIDYIFTNDKLSVLKHAIISSFRNGYYPSDHLLVLADIEMN
jgi:endonuclease/exonuclease/phosphatase family metal-dependent hydrolase